MTKQSEKVDVRHRILSEDLSEHTAMELPEEFVLNPQFTFSIPGPQPKEAFDELMDVLGEEEGITTRPQRSRTETRLYQAEEEEKKEKEKRAVKNMNEECRDGNQPS